MRRIGALAGLGLAAAALASAATPASARAPDLAACAPVQPGNPGERERTRPLPVPSALRGLLAADVVHYAVATLGGGTVCVDTSWIETVDDLVLSADRRFLSFPWLGYESYGHLMVDRSGKGQVVETGAAPEFSPSRRLLAAVDMSESEFGALSGLAIWRADPVGVREVTHLHDLPRMQRWRIDGWTGEACIALSALPVDLPPEQAERARRTRYAAKAGARGWRLSAAGGGCR